ncbi:hypothetical protein BB559_004685 [Furculomyces boomerangus]|uniref:MULE transposase domain-containing protein n=2 Tax=Harpellales TaxID=61421 RepID=A0A2T9YDB8_9FUNG|nr:hypothetical protein BB559_004685 [Furculomyces boomerangus]PVZ97170.1 hypothetical protein BB558_006885 [Smittium angustum]
MFESVCNEMKILTNDKSTYIVDYFSKFGNIKALITLKCMLSNISSAKSLHLDSTFKIDKANYPVIVAGVSDINRYFIHMALAVVSLDNKHSYAWLLETMLKELQNFNLLFNIKNIVADGAQQISNAIKKVLPLASRTNC